MLCHTSRSFLRPVSDKIFPVWTGSIGRSLSGHRCSSRFWIGIGRPDVIQAAEAAVGLVVKAGRPIQKIGSAEGGTIAEEDGPQPIDGDDVPLGIE
jgi:hypothetical protein